MEDIKNIDGAITFGDLDGEDDIDEENGPKIAGAAIPLGSIFSNMFSQVKQDDSKKSDNQSNSSNKKENVKTEKKNDWDLSVYF